MVHQAFIFGEAMSAKNSGPSRLFSSPQEALRTLWEQCQPGPAHAGPLEEGPLEDAIRGIGLGRDPESAAVLGEIGKTEAPDPLR